MTNIYNKVLTRPNGTLIDNWFEEDELRRATGTTRSVRGFNYGKITFDPETSHTSSEPRDNTFARIIGQKDPDKSYDTSNSHYGEVKLKIPKSNKPPLDERKQLAFLNDYLARSADKTKKPKIIEKPKEYEYLEKPRAPKPEYNYVGVRHLYTQDYLKVPWEKAIKIIPIEKLKKMGSAAEEQVELKDAVNIDGEPKKSSEVSKDGETPEKFWLNHINTGDVYRSFIKGDNPWKKSHAFTQPLQLTRGAIQYYQNAYDNPYGGGYNKKQEIKEEKVEEKVEEKLEDFNPENQHFSMNYGVRDLDDVDDSLYGQIMKKGWLGLRMLKRNFNMISKSFMVTSMEFKNLCSRAGYPINNSEIVQIFKKYDKVYSNIINYMQVFNDFRKVSESRKKEIENFNNQVKAPGCSFVSFAVIESMTDMNFHPDVTHFLRSVPQCQKDYLIAWDDLKTGDMIYDFAFQQFFYDVSTCVENDNDFTQILKSLGYK